MLSNLAGMQPYTFSKQDEERENKWKLYKSICSNFSKFYKNELFKNENSINAKNYLKSRGLSGVEVKNFNLGFVTEDLDYYEILKKDYDEEIIKNSGASSIKDMGKVMGELKKNHADTIDFSKAGQIIKNLLNS